MGWWRDDRTARDGRSDPTGAAYRNLEGDYLELRDYCTKLYADYQKAYTDYQQLLSSYRELRSAYSALEAQNTALREELEGTDSDWKATLKILDMYEVVNNGFLEEIKSLQAQRGVLLEGVDTLASVHHAECHDDQWWCAECRYAFPCPTHEIACQCSAKMDEFEHR